MLAIALVAQLAVAAPASPAVSPEAIVSGAERGFAILASGAPAAPETRLAVAATIVEALFQMNPAKSWPAKVAMSKQVADAYARMPSGLGADAAAAAGRYEGERGCRRGGECWHDELRFAGAVAGEGAVRYSFTRFLQAKDAEYPYCWITLTFETGAERNLLRSDAVESCTLRHED